MDSISFFYNIMLSVNILIVQYQAPVYSLLTHLEKLLSHVVRQGNALCHTGSEQPDGQTQTAYTKWNHIDNHYW